MPEQAPTIICVECPRCGHRGTIGADILRRYRLPPDVPLARLSRMLVCRSCGSHGSSTFRSSRGDARRFLAGKRDVPKSA